MEVDPEISNIDPDIGDDNPGDEDEQMPPQSEVVSLSIMLGDFIRIIAPTHQEIHEHTFLVDYLSSRKIKLVDIESRGVTILKLDANGNLTDESITSIQLLDRA
jgi:hypothetical protein